MIYLFAAVAIVGILCVLNLVLTFGVIRRLREDTARLAAEHRFAIEVGRRPAEFTARTIDGEEVSLKHPALVGFFAAGCEPCTAQIEPFVVQAAKLPDGAAQVLVVIDGTTETAQDYITALSPVAQIVLEVGNNGPVKSAFELTGFPSVFLLDDDGVVVASGMAVSDLKHKPNVAPA